MPGCFATKSQDGESMLMEGKPGGAPVNVLAQSTKLGLKTAYISKISDDPLGLFLKSKLDEAGIDTSGVVVTRIIPQHLHLYPWIEVGTEALNFTAKRLQILC